MFIAANSNNGQIKNFYNGKIDSLKIYDKETKLDLSKKTSKTFAEWDFSKFISSDKIFDKSINK